MYQPIKRLLDIIFAVLLAIVFFPVWLVVPLLIWIDSGSPVIYKHQRVGQNQKAFWLYKFRTMIKNADDVLYKKNKKLLQQFKRHDWKLKNDPRVTRLGRPRAYIARELKEQTKKYPKTKSMMATIFTVKPGITGPWQTSGRNEIPFDKRAAMDLNYAKRYNLISDLLIILRTPQAMLSKW